MERKLGAVLGALWVQICWVRGAEVEQSPSALSLHEGKSSTLSCNFSTTMTAVQWFRQNSRGSLINLFYLAPGRKENGRLNSTFDSKERYGTLYIRDAQLENSGTYLCAAYTQCSLQACSLSANCSWVFSYSAEVRRLCRRLFTAVALSDLHQLKGVRKYKIPELKLKLT
ncbi:T-cell receptor alpha chain V region 2B4 [Microtus ochrogaster]|nr:T-cell receptor alpha chain V region 2B4 [Microtus ochrogaster]